MTQYPLITIITPSYNQARYLEQTIRSVLTQDYPSLEYIIIDGGSTDGSLEVIQRYEEHLAQWISEPDQGQADAINKGIQRAHGEFITWLNSDDLYMPGALIQAAETLQKNPDLGMVFGDAITIDSDGNALKRLHFGDWGLLELTSFRIICQPAVMMRRDVLTQVGGLDRSYHFMLDHYLWIQIARISRIKHISQDWAAARHHPTAKNVAQAAGFGQETMRILSWIPTQPDLNELFQSHRKQIIAGAYRLNGRYLLDGGQPSAALRSYFTALLAQPSYALKHWHRMLYALLAMIGLGKPAQRIYQRIWSKKTNPFS